VAPNVDVDALLKRGDLATLASASRELETRARAALAGFVEECRLSIQYDELKSTVKDDLKAVAALLKQRAQLPSTGDGGQTAALPPQRLDANAPASAPSREPSEG
jgi:hypothetical protein